MFKASSPLVAKANSYSASNIFLTNILITSESSATSIISSFSFAAGVGFSRTAGETLFTAVSGILSSK